MFRANQPQTTVCCRRSVTVIMQSSTLGHILHLSLLKWPDVYSKAVPSPASPNCPTHLPLPPALPTQAWSPLNCLAKGNSDHLLLTNLKDKEDISVVMRDRVVCGYGFNVSGTLSCALIDA